MTGKNKIVSFFNKYLPNKNKPAPVYADKELMKEINSEISTEKKRVEEKMKLKGEENNKYLNGLINSYFLSISGKGQLDMKIFYDVFNKKWIKYANNFNHTNSDLKCNADSFKTNVVRILMEHNESLKKKVPNPSEKLKSV